MFDPMTPSTNPARDDAVALLPCPFCGGTDLRARTDDIDGFIAHIECRDCDDMAGPMSEFKYAGDEQAAIEDASRVWNRRAPAPAPASGVDAGRVTLFSALEAAYIRGAAWCAEMGMTHTFAELRKAAYDYADKEEKDVICRDASAPAPASGRVDAGLPGPNKQLDRVRIGEGEYVRADEAIKTVMELQRQLYDADKRLASLSPAATPVSGAEPVAAVVAEELALKIVSLSVNWLREDGTDREHDDYVRANWTKEIAEAKRLILAALAKPASSPAGGDVVRDALEKVRRWAESRCPCHNEEPNPCPLCGASVENLEACKSAENTLPRELLTTIRAALSPSTSAAEPVACQIDAACASYWDGIWNDRDCWTEDERDRERERMRRAFAAAHPAPAAVESAQGVKVRRDDPFRPAVDVDADDDYYPSREDD